MENKDTPIEPGINADGWYAYCPICYKTDLEPCTKRCPECNQLLDWTWFTKKENKKETIE